MLLLVLVTKTNNFENLRSSPVEGLTVVGRIDPQIISSLPSTSKKPVWLMPGDPVPEELEAIESLLLDTSVVFPADPMNVSVTKTSFSPHKKDPFEARFLADMMEERPQDPVHKDFESLFTRLVCDSNPTVFYPKDENGQADMSKGWQPEPGMLVEFDNEVWHSPPLHVEGNGNRTLLTLRVGIQDLDWSY